MIIPNRQKALQQYLLNNQEIDSNRIGFLKVEQGNGVAIVFNEGNWSDMEGVTVDYTKGIDIFPVLIDVVCKYEDYIKGYEVRNYIRKNIGKFNGKLTNDWEGTIAFRQFLSPVYNKDTNEIVLGSIYLLKQNFDYTPLTPETTEENVNDSNQELTEPSNSDSEGDIQS